MPIYDAEGKQLFACYDANGDALDHAYDASGNLIWSASYDTYPLIVMSYNVQDFTALNANQSMQAEIVSKYNPDIIGFQEFYRSATIPSIAQNILANYADIQLGPTVQNYVAMASKSIQFQNLTTGLYETQHGENRGWMKAYIPFHGKNICVVNTHLEVAYADTRYAQMQELFDMVQNEEYLIAIGDFNHYSNDTSSANWINMYKPLIDAGYHLANCKNDDDFNWTFANTSVNNVLQAPNAPDNIITSSNIDIVTTHYDMTKYDYVTTQNIDHIPMICELSVKIPSN